MQESIIRAKNFYAISLLIALAFTILFTGNIFAGDMASVSVTIHFWSTSRAKVSADSLSRVLSASPEEQSKQTPVAKEDREKNSLPVTATVYPVSKETDDSNNAVGGGGGREEVREEPRQESFFGGTVDILYDDSI